MCFSEMLGKWTGEFGEELGLDVWVTSIGVSLPESKYITRTSLWEIKVWIWHL